MVLKIFTGIKMYKRNLGKISEGEIDRVGASEIFQKHKMDPDIGLEKFLKAI